jgi:membrane fusion protein, multidrug efflux system
MRKFLILGLLVIGAGGAAVYFGLLNREQSAAAAGQRDAQGAPGGMGGGFGGGGRGGAGGGFRPPMTVEVAKVTRGTIAAHLSVVGNLIGEQTVDVAPKTGGRLTAVNVKLGDRVRRGQLIAKLDDSEIVQQVRQAEASQLVGEATIRQREADLNLASTSVERSRNLYGRQLLPKQTLDDAEARYSAALAQVDLARAQLAQSAARLQELQINLSHTNVVSPVDGFVSRRNVDAGAWVSQNAPVVEIVDISSLRLVANVVEKDMRMVTAGDRAVVEVDAYPGETFNGRIARVSPILDPATRTAAMEIEIANRDFRLKPGMYAKVNLEVESREQVLVVPKIALVDVDGVRGVYLPSDEGRATFRPVKIGLEDADRAEILDGINEGETIVSTGAGALRRNDQLVVAGQEGAPRGPGQGGPGAPNAGERSRRGPGSEGSGSGGGVPPGGRGGQGVQDGQGGQDRPRMNGGQTPSGQPARRQQQQRPIA